MIQVDSPLSRARTLKFASITGASEIMIDEP